MPRNRRKNANLIEVGSLTRWLVAAFFLGVMGLCYVYLKNQLHTTGGQIKGLEKELSELTVENDLLRTKISTLSSQKVLQRRLDQDFIKMIPIAEASIVRIHAPERIGAGEIHAVSNEGPAK